MIRFMIKVFEVMVIVLAVVCLLLGTVAGWFLGSYYGVVRTFANFETLVESFHYEYSVFCIFGAVIGLVGTFIAVSLVLGVDALLIDISRSLRAIKNNTRSF